jgi:hypothetical protein
MHAKRRCRDSIRASRKALRVWRPRAALVEEMCGLQYKGTMQERVLHCGRTGFLNVNGQLIGEWVRVGAKGLRYQFAVLTCCIRSHATFFQTRWPLIVSAPEPRAGSEK